MQNITIRARVGYPLTHLHTHSHTHPHTQTQREKTSESASISAGAQGVAPHPTLFPTHPTHVRGCVCVYVCMCVCVYVCMCVCVHVCMCACVHLYIFCLFSFFLLGVHTCALYTDTRARIQTHAFQYRQLHWKRHFYCISQNTLISPHLSGLRSKYWVWWGGRKLHHL